MRRWRLLAWLLLTLLLVTASVAGWLLHTTSGLRFVVARAQAALPELRIGQAAGTLGSTIELQDIQYRNASVNIRLQQARGDLGIPSLLAGNPRLGKLNLQGLRVQLLPAPATATSTDAVALPALRIDALQIDDFAIEGVAEAPMHWQSLRAGLTMTSSAIALRDLRVEQEQYTLLGATVILPNEPWLLGASDLRLQTKASAADPIDAHLRRSSAEMGEAIDIELKQPLDIVARLRPGKRFEQFELALKLPEQDAGALGLGPEYPLSADLQLVRTGVAFQLSGVLAAGGHQARIAPAQLQWHDTLLRIDSLAAQLGEAGTVSLQGQLPLAPDQPMQLLLQSEGLLLARGDAPPIKISGSVEASGRYAELHLKPSLRIEQDGLPPGRLDGLVELSASAIRFDALALRLPRGSLTVAGSLSRDLAAEATLKLTLAEFDPSQLLADWPGTLQGDLEWRGAWGEQGATGALDISGLSGQLRGQALQARGKIELIDSSLRGADLAVALADARMTLAGDISGPQPLRLELTVPDLAVVDSAASGQLRLQADRDQRWSLAVSAADLNWANFALQRLDASGSVGLSADDAVALRASFTGLQQGDLLLDAGSAQIDGSRSEHALTLQLSARASQLQISASGGWNNARWDGVIDQADLLVSRDRGLRLQQPLALVIGSNQVSLSESCWSGSDEAHFCTGGELVAGTGSFTFDLGNLPLSWANDWLVGTGYSVEEAVLQGTARAAWKDYKWISANAELRSPRGLLRFADRPDLLLGYQALHLQTEYAEGAGIASLSTDLLPEGHADAAFEYRFDDNGALAYDGTISALIRELDAIEAFTTEIANPVGLVTGQFRLQQDAAGFRAGGSMTLSGFKADVPGLGLKLSEGSVALAGVPEGLILRGAVKSGDGTLTVDGRWSRNLDEGLALSIGGDKVRLSNTPELNLVATPALKLSRDQQGWNLTGTLDIPRARILADQLGTTSVQSNDVVVIDDVEDTTADERWRARVLVRMGDDVQLKGFGFDGSLRGQLNVQQSSGRSAIATGQLDVTGDYTAYGQKLAVKTGELLYAASPLDEPSVRVRAEREIGERTAGIEITGTARKLSSRVYARPDLSESEALSLLVTGRSLRDVRSGEQSKLSGAALALGTIGGDMLAKNLGLDELGVSSNAGLRGEAFTIGKYLSPRLYIGYGIGLLDRGEVFTVRYLIKQRIEVEANIGERQRASVNYRIER